MRIMLAIAATTATLAACASYAQPAEPPAGPWAMMLSVPYDPGSQPVVSWISEDDVIGPPENEEAYINEHWQMMLHQPASSDPDPARWTLSRMRYICGDSAYAVLETRVYQGDTLVETTGPEAPTDVIPHTLAAFTMNAVCRNGIADAAPRAADRAAAITEQAAFLERWNTPR
ncbi:MAG: hypothetical protein V7678_07810 [Brevundimonas sp.]